jgi:hypothetical protein
MRPMPSQHASEPSNFRITLFYGPESVHEHPGVQRCVFNVKKRSWKGGVQVAIDLEETQVARARTALRFDDWLQDRLMVVAQDDRLAMEERASELFIQSVAALKLDLAIEAGLPQKNQHLDSRAFINELDQRLGQAAEHIKSQILVELDLPAA